MAVKKYFIGKRTLTKTEPEMNILIVVITSKDPSWIPERMIKGEELLFVSPEPRKTHKSTLEKLVAENLKRNPIVLEFAKDKYEEVVFPSSKKKVAWPKDIPSHRVSKKLAGKRPLQIRGFECRKKKPKKGRE